MVQGTQPLVRWGILGCGNVTEVKSGPAFQQVEGSALVAVMRRNGDLAADRRPAGLQACHVSAAGDGPGLIQPALRSGWVGTQPCRYGPSAAESRS